MGQKRWKLQLHDMFGEALMTAGGRALVVTAGANTRQAITDVNGAAATNPVTPTRGMIEFYTADTVTSVDLYVMAATGHFAVVKGVSASGNNEIYVDTQNRHQLLVCPFDISDMVAAAEFNIGFLEPTNAIFLPNPAVLVETLDATETIDVGTNTDPNGFLAAASVATAALVKGTLASGGQTIGALLSADESGAGVLVPEGHVSTGDVISATLSAGSDTADGKIILPYYLADF